MKTQVSLVGRTNVGKSLLFNKLVKARKSLVVDHHGSTRDTNQGISTFNGKSIVVEDTGGFPETKATSNVQIESKIIQSINESNLILFMTSCNEGLTPKDIEISKIIRKLNKRALLLINKCDLTSKIDNINTFYQLGYKDIFIISAKSNLGILKLQEKIFELVTESKVIDSKKNLRVSFIGKPNVGKSTLINAVIKEERMITSENAGTTLDAVEIKFKIRKNIYSLYDTAGLLRKSKTISKIQKFSITQTLNTIKDTDLCLLILNAEDGINKQDKIILNLIKRHNKAFFIIVNKIDKISQIDMKKLKRDIRYFSNIANKAHCIFVSAAMKKNINKISSMIISVSNMLYIRYKPSRLTQILNEATSKHEPPIYNKKRPKLKFAQQSKFKDLIIHIYGNGIKNLSPSYQKYLSNYFLEELNLLGIPLELKFTQKKEPI